MNHSENSTQMYEKWRCERNGYFYAYIALGCCIVIINVSVAALISRTKQLRKSSSNCVLLSLSMNDCLTGIATILATLPILYMTVDCKLTTTSKSIGLLTYYIGKFSLINSITHLTLLCCERTISVYAPLRHRAHVTKHRTFKLIACLWTLCGLLTFVEYLFFKNSKSKERRNLEIAIFVLFGSIPTLLLLCQYAAILFSVSKYHKKRETKLWTRTATKGKALLIYSIMFLTFLMLAYPFFVVRLYTFYNGIEPLLKYVSMLSILRVVPSLTNPFIYAFYKDDFRCVLKKLSSRLVTGTVDGSSNNSSGKAKVARQRTEHTQYDKRHANEQLDVFV